MIRDSAAGVISAAPTPCAPRARTISLALEANPLTSEAAVNTNMPVMKTRCLGSRSAIRPPRRRPPPDISR